MIKKLLTTKNILIAIFILAILLNFFHLGQSTFGTDEAEIILASNNIFESGVPKGFYKVPFYENAFHIESNSSMYEFKPTNYANSDLVIMKGWFTYYLTAFFLLFGKSEFWLRFPFALMSIFSLFMIYKLSELLFNKRTALIASFFFAVSPSILLYNRMLRYFSPLILLLLASSYFFIKAFKTEDRKYYLYGTIAFVLLFYTHILACFTLGIVLLVYRLITYKNINKENLYSAGLFAIFTLPWILGVSFFKNIASQPKFFEFSNMVPNWFFFQSVIASIANQGLLYLFLELGIIILLLNILFHKKIKDYFFYWKNKDTNYFLLTFVVCFIFFPAIIAPFTGFEERLFLPLLPFFIIIAAKIFESILKISKHKHYKIAIILLLIIFSFVHVDSIFGRKGHNFLEYSSIIQKQDNEFISSIKTFLEENDVDNNTLILTTSEHFPLLFYTDNVAQMVWPVRKDFINNYRDELIIIEKEPLEGGCNFFNVYVNNAFRCANNKNYLEKIQNCKGYALTADTNLYHCKADTNFIGGSLGLYFADFPKDSPPDFIWDRHPFPVNLEINNFGEEVILANKAKLVFSKDFATDFFDSNKEPVFIPYDFKSVSFENNELNPGRVLFELGNISYQYKLTVKSKVIDASVRLCYPYTTKLRIDTCKDSVEVCSSDISGAPVGLDSINYYFDDENVFLNFSVVNSAEGIIGSIENCEEYEETNEVKINSKKFKCEQNDKLIFSCKAKKSELKKDSSYIIKINYDYQQEFSKSLLLRNKEFFERDYNLDVQS